MNDLNKRIYNGLDVRIGWPTVPYTAPSGTYLRKKTWWVKCKEWFGL